MLISRYRLIRQIGAASIVLLKNTNNALPLNKPASLAVIGNDAIPNPSGINSCSDRGCDQGTLAQGWYVIIYIIYYKTLIFRPGALELETTLIWRTHCLQSSLALLQTVPPSLRVPVTRIQTELRTLRVARLPPLSSSMVRFGPIIYTISDTNLNS